MEEPVIVVGIPYTNESSLEVRKVQKLYEKRAGLPCQVVCTPDINRIGWVAMHNLISRTYKWDWYVYSAIDYFPGREWLKLALKKAETTGKTLIGFNDGKWRGSNATAGLVHKSVVVKYGCLFPDVYKSHGADPELTEKCQRDGLFAYEPEALLVEIDYEKDFISKTNKDDYNMYLKRKQEGFPK
jgi:hypothetical protein